MSNPTKKATRPGVPKSLISKALDEIDLLQKGIDKNISSPGERGWLKIQLYHLRRALGVTDWKEATFGREKKK